MRTDTCGIQILTDRRALVAEDCGIAGVALETAAEAPASGIPAERTDGSAAPTARRFAAPAFVAGRGTAAQNRHSHKTRQN